MLLSSFYFQFIEDSYVSSASKTGILLQDEDELPSLGSLTIGDAALAKAAAADSGGGGHDDSGPASGIFIEDSYVDASGTGLEEFKEKENEEAMEKELSTTPPREMGEDKSSSKPLLTESKENDEEN